MMTIEIRGGMCVFIYSASVSDTDKACIVSITLFSTVWYVKQCSFCKMKWEQMLFCLVN